MAKFSELYPTSPIYRAVGSEGVARDDRLVPCAVCGELTNYTEPFYGGWVCSQECLRDLYKNAFPEHSEMISRLIDEANSKKEDIDNDG